MRRNYYNTRGKSKGSKQSSAWHYWYNKARKYAFDFTRRGRMMYAYYMRRAENVYR